MDMQGVLKQSTLKQSTLKRLDSTEKILLSIAFIFFIFFLLCVGLVTIYYIIPETSFGRYMNSTVHI